MSETTTTTTVKTRGRRNEAVGEVISDKMDKTISVKIFRTVKHSKYHKYIKRTSVFKAHDETNEAKTGDIVRIYETRPLSKSKRWKLSEIVEKSK
jgi:small subunit ribosomal protein S17